jgi:hypothetical protein
MKILHTATITIAIILMIIVSPVAFGTLSFAARTNSIGTSAQHNNITASSSRIPTINTPKITTTTTTPASHNATTTNTTLMGAPGSYPGSYTCSRGDNFLWNHVYGVSGSGKDPWSQPGPNHPGKSRLTVKTPPCIRVTGTVYSQPHPPPSTQGTHDDPDGDLHFTLTLDPQYVQYSDKNNCKTAPMPTGCNRIIVEVICHNPGLASKSGYFNNPPWGDYCSGVDSEYMRGQFPKQGEKLTVSGRFVHDTGTEDWNEIHPASKIIPNP